MKRVARFYGWFSVALAVYMIFFGISLLGLQILIAMLVVHYGENILYRQKPNIKWAEEKEIVNEICKDIESRYNN